MIEKLSTKSRTTEIADTASLIVRSHGGSGLASDGYLKGVMDGLYLANDELIEAVNRAKAKSDLHEKNAIRNEALRALHYFLVGLLHHPAPEIRAAAQRLKKVFDKYGLKIIRENFSVQTALVTSMLNDFSKPERAPDVATLSGCREVVQTLRAAHTDFGRSRMAFESSKAEEAMLENATVKSKVVLHIVNQRLAIYLNAMTQMDEPRYGELVRNVAQIIADNNQRVKNRGKKPGQAGAVG